MRNRVLTSVIEHALKPFEIKLLELQIEMQIRKYRNYKILFDKL
jgi:hypothetical protein